MQYFSPFVIPGLVADEFSLQRQNVQAAKKRLLSEFELLGNPPTIELAGWELDRNELLEVLDGMNNASTREYHLAIHRDENLLKFLEQHELSEKSNFSDNPLYGTPGFIAFVSPYFLEAYRNAIAEAFRNRDVPLLIALKKLPLLCTPETQDRAYGSVRSEVIMLVASLEEETASTVYNEASVLELTSKPTLAAVAALPEQVGMRENFFEALCGLCITLFNKHKKQHKAIDVLYRVKHANVNSAINAQAADYIRQMEQIMSNWREQDERRQVKGGGLVFGVMITVVIVILKIALSSKHNPKGFDYRLPQGYQNLYAVTTHADSIARYMHAYYLEHPADDSTGGDVLPPAAGSHPYASALDELFRLQALLKELKPDSMPGVYFVNDTREDLALLLRSGDKSFSMSLYIPDGDSCFSSLFDCQKGFLVYVSAGSRWDSSKKISLSNSGRRSIPSLSGAFSSPDRKNLDLLIQPVSVKSGQAPPGLKHYRLVFSRNKKGKIGTKLFPGDENVK